MRVALICWVLSKGKVKLEDFLPKYLEEKPREKTVEENIKSDNAKLRAFAERVNKREKKKNDTTTRISSSPKI